MEFHADGERETVEEELVEVRDKAGTKHSRAVAEGREALRHVALAVVLAVTTVIAAITVSVKDGDSESPPRPVLPALLGGLTALAVLSAALRVGRVSLATPWHAADSSTTQRYSPGDVAGESGPEQEHGHEGEHSSGHGWRIVNRSPGARGREPGWMMGTPAALLIAAALAVVTQIVLRLVFAAPSSHFGGRIEDLDFGDKCASGGGNQTIERATNRAFDPNAESLGHWLWGVTALFSFVRTQHKLGQMMAEYALVLVCIYPIYNLIKRAASSDVFARSSFANNGCEWAVGVLYGLAVGLVARGVVLVGDDPPALSMYGQVVQSVAAAMLWGVSIALAALLIDSWDDSCGTTDTVKRDPTRDVVTVLLVVPPVIVAGLAVIAARRWSRTQGPSSRSPLPRGVGLSADGFIPHRTPNLSPNSRASSSTSTV